MVVIISLSVLGWIGTVRPIPDLCANRMNLFFVKGPLGISVREFIEKCGGGMLTWPFDDPCVACLCASLRGDRCLLFLARGRK